MAGGHERGRLPLPSQAAAASADEMHSYQRCARKPPRRRPARADGARAGRGKSQPTPRLGPAGLEALARRVPERAPSTAWMRSRMRPDAPSRPGLWYRKSGAPAPETWAQRLALSPGPPPQVPRWRRAVGTFFRPPRRSVAWGGSGHRPPGIPPGGSACREPSPATAPARCVAQHSARPPDQARHGRQRRRPPAMDGNGDSCL